MKPAAIVVACLQVLRGSPAYMPLEKVGDDAIKPAGLKFATPQDQSALLKRASAPPDLQNKVGRRFSQS